MTAGVALGRCNPYGAETGGPRRVLGGLYGPGSAATPGMDLPENVAQGEWLCAEPAVIRCRMICRCGHKGQVMALCSWHDETVISGELVAGTFRQVRATIRVRGHFEEIQRRQSGSCPRCLFPGEFAALQKETESWAWELALLHAADQWRSARAQEIRAKVETIGRRFDQARAVTCSGCQLPRYVWDTSGCGGHRLVDLAAAVHNCPMTLTPVS